MFESIETLRLRLRSPRPEDATAISAMMTPQVSRWLASWPSPLTTEMAAERIAAATQANADGSALLFVIEQRQDGATLGWIGIVRNPPASNRGMLGYWLGEGEAYQGQGYMREAAPAAMAAAFARLGLEVVEAAAQPENAASFAVMRACGMQPAGEYMVFAPTRGREELCQRYEAAKPR
jgi:[ribosomal protein S5]-alanine N-acetyltransferase